MKVNAILFLILASFLYTIHGKIVCAGINDYLSSPSAVRDYNPVLAAPPAAVITAHREKTIFLVDVRPSTAFEQYRIAGALNIPCHAIKAKGFLKAKPIVLVNEGFDLHLLVKTCSALNEFGFSARILAGGLMAWRQKGGELVGDPFAIAQMNRVSPRQLHQELGHAGLWVIDASAPADRLAGSLIPGARRLPLSDGTQAVNAFEDMIGPQAPHPFSRVVVVAATDRENDRIIRLLGKAGIGNIFCIKGGLAAYRRHLQHNKLARRSVEERTVSTGECTQCGAN